MDKITQIIMEKFVLIPCISVNQILMNGRLTPIVTPFSIARFYYDGRIGYLFQIYISHSNWYKPIQSSFLICDKGDSIVYNGPDYIIGPNRYFGIDGIVRVITSLVSDEPLQVQQYNDDSIKQNQQFVIHLGLIARDKVLNLPTDIPGPPDEIPSWILIPIHKRKRVHNKPDSNKKHKI